MFDGLTGKCPVSPALEGGMKGRNINGNDLTEKPRPLGHGALQQIPIDGSTLGLQ